MTPDLSWDELMAAGVCECGQALADHPALPKPKPMGWTGRQTVASQGGRRPLAQSPSVHRGRRFIIHRQEASA